MNRFSYLAAISYASAAGDAHKSTQVLLEKGIQAQANIRTFRYTNVFDQTVGNTDMWFKATVYTTLEADLIDDTKAANKFSLKNNEFFIVEVDHSSFLKSLVEVVVQNAGTQGTIQAPQFPTNAAGSVEGVLVTSTAGNAYTDGTLVGADIATAVNYVRNYRYPAYYLKCTGTAEKNYWFGLVAQQVGGTAADYYYKTFGCLNKAARPLAHATLAELQSDSSNRLVASTVTKLSGLAQFTGLSSDTTTTTNPATGDKWLEFIDPAVTGTKIAGEHLVIGANVAIAASGVGATIAVAAAVACKSHSAGAQQHASVQLNPLTPDLGKYVTTAAWADATNYNAEAFRVPANATPGQKYYACLTIGITAGARYTTVEVTVGRPVWWQGTDASKSTNFGASQGSATVAAGLPNVSEWGFTATNLATSSPLLFGTGTKSAVGAQPSKDIGALTAAEWFTSGSGTTRVTANAYSVRNGEYIAIKLTSSANKLIAHFWTGQAGMGRGLPAAGSGYEHLEVFSFAQPGSEYLTTDGQPVIVLRVPVAAAVNAKYYAGFQISDDTAVTNPLFYTASFAVTVKPQRRYGNVADFDASLLQPLFQAQQTISAAPTAVLLTTPMATANWVSLATITQGTAKTPIWKEVTGAIPGQVVAFVLPDRCRLDAVYTNDQGSNVTPTDGWKSGVASTPAVKALNERGSFQGNTDLITPASTVPPTTPGTPGRASFVVDSGAASGSVYYAGMLVKNVATDNWAAVKVTVATFASTTPPTTNVYVDGVTTLGSATVTVAANAIGTNVLTASGWWTTNVLTPTLELYDEQKAIIAFNANVGMTDRTATDSTLAAKDILGVTGRYAHIPAAGFTSASLMPAIEYKMDLTANLANLEFGTSTYVYRTYAITSGANTYYGAVRAKVMEPEVFTTKTTFDAAIPFSASTYTTTATAAWVKAATPGTEPVSGTGTAAGIWADLSTNAAAGSSPVNKVTANVNNGDSFVVALDHDVVVTWLPLAVKGTAGAPASLNALVRREQLDCAAWAVGVCYPSYSFRVPQNAVAGHKYYAAGKAVVTGATSNVLAVGTYYFSVIATVTEPVRHYPTWAAMTAARSAISYKWANTGMPTVSVPAGNNGWQYDVAAKVAGWQETLPLAVNVAPSSEVCFDFSDSTNAFTLSTLTLETAAAKAGATPAAYAAGTGLQPTLVAQVTGAQLANTKAALNVAAWCFTAPATGFGYVIVKSGAALYLPIKVDVTARARTFPTVAALVADSGTRWQGSVVRTYSDLSKQWANTVSGSTTIDTTYLIDEVAVKAASDVTDLTGAVTVGAFAVAITDTGFTSCTEYTSATMFDTATVPVALARPTTWLTSFGSVDDPATTNARIGASQWAFSWQVPTASLAADVYYLGLRCKSAVAGDDFSAMWKVSVTDRPVFAAATASLAKATGSTAFAFTGFASATEGKWIGGAVTVPAIPDPRPRMNQPVPVTKSFEVEAGKGFSVTLSLTGVTASVVAEEDLVDEYAKPLNLEARSLILYGEVAKITTVSVATVGSEVKQVWGALGAADATIYPGFSWQVPAGAEVGEVHYAAVRATTTAGLKYVALFECTVKAAPAPVPEVVEEASGVMGAVITTALVTAAIAAALFFFVL